MFFLLQRELPAQAVKLLQQAVLLVFEQQPSVVLVISFTLIFLQEAHAALSRSQPCDENNHFLAVAECSLQKSKALSSIFSVSWQKDS